MNFFAIVYGDEGSTVARIPVEQNLQGAMKALFSHQEEEFFAGDPDEIPFSPSHTPDESEIVYIDGYTLPEEITSAIENPLDQDVLNFDSKAIPRIKGIFAGSKSKAGLRVRFQAFERRRLLDPHGFSIFLSKNTFRRITEPGLTLDSKLTAVYRNGQLYFYSFFIARRMLDLGEYYRIATDEDLDKLVAHPLVYIEDVDVLRENADEWVRRRIALIQDSPVMKNIKPKEIAAEATTYDLHVDIKKEKGKDKIVFPSDKKELKQLLRFLDQNYYTSSLTGDKFVASSKRVVELASS